MPRLIAVLVLLSACAITDVADGEVENVGDCCWLFDADAIDRCVQRNWDDSLDTNRDGCIVLSCFDSWQQRVCHGYSHDESNDE